MQGSLKSADIPASGQRYGMRKTPFISMLHRDEKAFYYGLGGKK
ncbi:hypothetical protein CHCC20375_3032 [Bacillus licheniformis]|nr:hypothetical protein CHCC20375_3032 [Bacillus licheniformis]